MEIIQRTSEGVVVLDLQGPIALGQGEEDLRRRIAQLLEEKHTSILLNLENVDFVDSSGAGALVKCLTLTTRAGGKLKILRPRPMVEKVLKVIGVHKLFEFHDDEGKALSSFG